MIYILGEANILQLFDITEGKREVYVMGCRCSKGVLKKNAKFKVLRNNEILHTDELDSMRHLKNEVDTIKKDVECGLRLKSQNFVPQIGEEVFFAMHIFFPYFTLLQVTLWFASKLTMNHSLQIGIRDFSIFCGNAIFCENVPSVQPQSSKPIV